MNIDDYNVLNDILADMRHELSEQNENMKYHEQCIKQDDIFIQSFTDSEPDDFKLFSPRNAEDVHRGEIEKTVSDKESLVKRIDMYIGILDNRIATLNKDIGNRVRICRMLGITGGAFLTILIV